MRKPHRPFPWKCSTCGTRAVSPAVFSYGIEIGHDGRSYNVTVPDLNAPRCAKCGEAVITSDADEQISEAFRQQLGLLSPAEIRAQREAQGLTQKELADLLGIAEATLSRWETGAQIQQRAFDRFLRLFFTMPEVRARLEKEACAP